MDASNLNIYVVGGFLLFNLVVGIVAGRGIKDIKDYAVANRSYGVGVISITFLATYFEGDNIFHAQKGILSHGLIAGLGLIFSGVMFLYAAKWIAPKFISYNNCYTLGDLMKIFYGITGEIISGIIGTLYCTIILTIQLVSLGILCEDLLNWDFTYSILLIGGIVVLYSSFGGIRAITITDILQFAVFIIMIPIMLNIFLRDVGGFVQLFKKLPSDKLLILGHEKQTYYISTWLFGWLLPGYFASPPILQRVLMVNSRRSASNVLYISSGVIILVRIALILMCFSVIVLSNNSVTSNGGAFTYVINHYCSPLAKSISIVGILAVLMSTMDSFLNSAGLLLARNVLKPFTEKSNFKISELKSVMTLTLLIGGISITMAIMRLEINFLAWLAYAVCITVITFPMLFGVFKLKTNFQTFLFSMLVTIGTLICSMRLMPYYLAVPLSLFINIVSYLLYHIIQNRGIVFRKNSSEEVKWVPSFAGLRNTFSNLVKCPQYLDRYLFNQFRVYNPQYVAIAFTVCFSYMFPYLSERNEGGYQIEIIKLISVCLCIALMLHQLWSKWFTKNIHFVWHLALFYCLPFTNTVLFLINHGTTPYLVNMVATVMLISYFVDVKGFLFMNIVGGMLAYFCARSLPGYIPVDYELVVALICIYLSGGVVGLVFARHKQKALRILSFKNLSIRAREKYLKRLLATTLEQEENMYKSLGTIELGLSEGMQQCTENAKQVVSDLLDIKTKPEDAPLFQKVRDTISYTSQKLDIINDHVQNIVKRGKIYLKLEPEVLTIEDLEAAIDSTAKAAFEGDYSIVLHTKENSIRCDYYSIRTLLYMIADEMNSENITKQDIVVDISDTELIYKLSFLPGYEKKIKALRLTFTTALDIYPSCYKESYKAEFANPREIKMIRKGDINDVAISKILTSHYGVQEIIDSGENGTTMIYVIPVDVRDIRPIAVDL